MQELRIDASRIMQRCDALARHSELPGGLTRVFLSREARAAGDMVLGWMREAGMEARLDAIGNAVGGYEGERPRLPCVMLGSLVRCKGGISHNPAESITEDDAAIGASAFLSFIENFRALPA